MAQDISKQYDTRAKALFSFFFLSLQVASFLFRSALLLHRWFLFLHTYSIPLLFSPSFSFSISFLSFPSFLVSPLFRQFSSSYEGASVIRTKPRHSRHKLRLRLVREFGNRGHTHGTKTAFDPEATLIVDTPFVCHLPTSLFFFIPVLDSREHDNMINQKNQFYKSANKQTQK